MKRTIITTADGSTTIHLEAWNEQYHSKHGAVQEAYHVFVDHGLSTVKKKDISILEIGFGTGLNALITFLEATSKGMQISYTGIERYPVTAEELAQLNYISELKADTYSSIFTSMHGAS